MALSALFAPLAVRTPSWPNLEKRLPSSVAAAPAIFDAATVSAADLAGKTVLFRDRNGWCPYAERAWLALELKRIDYATVLVDSDYSDTPCEPGSLPRVQWSDGTTHDGSQIIDILERLEVEQPQPPQTGALKKLITVSWMSVIFILDCTRITVWAPTYLPQ